MQVRDQGNERPAVYVYSTFCVRLASLADSDCHENVYPAAQTVSMNRILVCLNSTAGLGSIEDSHENGQEQGDQNPSVLRQDR